VSFSTTRTGRGEKGGSSGWADRKGDGGGGVVVEAASPSLSVSTIRERQERANL